MGRVIAAAVLAFGLLATPGMAGCRLALVLAVDVSRSIDEGDYEIQRGGLLLALADPGIRAAFVGPADPVALSVMEWSGRAHQEVVLDWRLIGTEADLDEVMAVIAAHVRSPDRLPTGLGTALEFALGRLAAAPPCAAQVIDLSGDGRNNDGFGPDEAYVRTDFGAVTVNGLAIVEHERDIVEYFQDHLIRGPGAFVEVALGQRDYPRAMARKLYRELTDDMAGRPAGGGG